MIQVCCQKLQIVKNLILKQEQLGLNSGIKLVKSSELYCQTGYFGLNSDPLLNCAQRTKGFFKARKTETNCTYIRGKEIHYGNSENNCSKNKGWKGRGDSRAMCQIQLAILSDRRQTSISQMPDRLSETQFLSTIPALYYLL